MADFDPCGFAPREAQTYEGPRLCDVLNYGYDLGLRDYPIFDESYRDQLNQKIVDHFYTREISAATPGEFVMRLNVLMAEHMPQINAVYRMLAERDPLVTSTSRTNSSGETSSNDSATNSTTQGSTAYASNAPQVSMVGKDEVDYYDTGNRTSSDASGESSSESTSNSTQQTGTETSSGALSALIAAWYDGYNNGDLLVFEALEPLFMHVYGYLGGAYF